MLRSLSNGRGNAEKPPVRLMQTGGSYGFGRTEDGLPGRAQSTGAIWGERIDQAPMPSGEKIRYITATTAAPVIAQTLPLFHGVISMTLASGISHAS